MLRVMGNVFIKKEIYNRLFSELKDQEKEQGGILGCGSDGVISAFFPDPGKDSCPGKYIPDTTVLNKVIQDWNACGIRFCGIIHTHTNGRSTLTETDLEYGRRIISCFPELKQLYLPLMADGTLYFYMIDRAGVCSICEVVVV